MEGSTKAPKPEKKPKKSASKPTEAEPGHRDRLKRLLSAAAKRPKSSD